MSIRVETITLAAMLGNRLWRGKRRYREPTVLILGGGDGNEKWFPFWMCFEGRADRFPDKVYVGCERKKAGAMMTPPESNLTHCLLNLPGLPIIYYKQ